MDKKDISILQVLDKNPRFSYRQIGKRTRMAEETVQYRVKRMINEKIITGFWGLPHVGNNLAVYKMLLKNRSLSFRQKEEFENFLQDNKFVAWAAETEGTWSYILTIIGKDHEATNTLNIIAIKFSKFFSDIQILKSISITALNERYLYEKPPIYLQENSFFENPLDLDKKDLEIVNILGKDSRASSTSISEKIGLTPEATARRIKKLIKERAFITLKPRIDHTKLELQYFHVIISFLDLSLMKQIKEYWTNDSSCVFIMEHVGKYQLHIELVSKPNAIEKNITKFAEKFPDYISSYEICPISREIKIGLQSIS